MLLTGFWTPSHIVCCGSDVDRAVWFPIWIIFFLDDMFADKNILIGLIVMSVCYDYCVAFLVYPNRKREPWLIALQH